MTEPRVTILVLCYGNYAALARRTINSILEKCARAQYKLIVGANECGAETHGYLQGLLIAGKIDALVVEPVNVNKCPLMRKMLDAVTTQFVWWFDDDSYITDPAALDRRLVAMDRFGPRSVLAGHVFFYHGEVAWSYGEDVKGFVKSAPWFTGAPPPSGVLEIIPNWPADRWFFVTGGCWFARTGALRLLNWPDPRLIKRNDDVFLCEAVRQAGYKFEDIGPCGCIINDAPRRGVGEDPETMRKQVRGV
jgi:hypothetical protein